MVDGWSVQGLENLMNCTVCILRMYKTSNICCLKYKIEYTVCSID